MYVQLKILESNETIVLSVFRSMVIKPFKELVQKKTGIDISKQRLFFLGKQVSYLLTISSRRKLVAFIDTIIILN